MRSALGILFLVAAFIVPAQAQHWCSISSEGYSDCSFAAMSDCRANVTGTGGNCMPEAPVGHRQPGNARVSPPDTKLDTLVERLNKKNDKLNLCRGC